MIRPMFGYRPKPRKFNLPLRYYDPEKEERELNREKRRIKIESHVRTRPKQFSRVVFLALSLGLVVYIISLLG